MKLRSWNDLAEEVRGLPMAVGAALATGRPELLANSQADNWTAEESVAVLCLVRVLIETNQALQDHSVRLARRSNELHLTVKGLVRSVDGLRDLANFRDPDGI